MTRFATATLMAAIVVAASGVTTSAQEISVEALPPSVVKTVPACGTKTVPATTRQIKVTFSKKMMNGSWSWSQVSPDSFPEIVGKPKYAADGKTCILNVKLRPKKTYALWLNSQKFQNFKDASGKPAVPYLLVFKTK